MPVQAVLRPLKVLRRDSADSTIAAAGTLDSESAPCSGYGTMSVYCRAPGAATLEVYQRLRENSTFRLTDSFAVLAATTIREIVVICGEHVRVLYTNNAAVTQAPEILCELS